MGEPSAGPSALRSSETFVLLERARHGDTDALDRLFARYLKPLQRWASGRLPMWARNANAVDTQDLVQDTLMNAFRRLDSFEVRREGALLAYLRQALMNRVRDELRRAQVRPTSVELVDDLHEFAGASPFDETAGLELLDRYDAALSRLAPLDREAIVARIEFGQSYETIATSLGKPTPNAARVAVTRALVRLAAEMKHGG